MKWKRRQRPLKNAEPEEHTDDISRQISIAVKALARGGVIAFPTETYYGLGADPFNNKALERLFALKQRDEKKPVLVLVESVDMLSLLADDIPTVFQPLMRRYWPGPLTLILPALESVPALLTGGTGTIGVRISPNPVVQAILQGWQSPVTATSANISGTPPAAEASSVRNYFSDAVDCIVDGGRTPAGLCSTIISCEEGRLKLLREGQIPFQELVAHSGGKTG